MSESVISKKRFSHDDVQWFAKTSGDWNPIHVNPVLARRLLTGELVVHGIFTLLWALDEYFAATNRSVSSIVASFLRPVALDDELSLMIDDNDQDTTRLTIQCNKVIIISVLMSKGGGHVSMQPNTERPKSMLPKDNSFKELKNCNGSITTTISRTDLQNRFAHVERVLGAMPVASLMALSRLVGMECPGLHSLLTSLNIYFDQSRDSNKIDWHVSRHIVAHAPIRMVVDGGAISGYLDAFVRPAPVSQSHIKMIAAEVSPTMFSDQVALIIGGSRGLGELTAKIVAAGGGQAVVTYLQGADDAEHVVNEIVEWGGVSRSLMLDVASPQSAVNNLMKQGIVPTHMYYFATPRIGINKHQDFDLASWRRFDSVFIEGFARVIECLKKTFEIDLKVFYPSTIFIDEQLYGFSEYIAAKAAGEALCSNMTKNIDGLQILHRRLPRLPTDQTAGLVRSPTAAPLPLMLEVVNDMQLMTCEENK